MAFAAVYYVLFGPLRQEGMARDRERRAAYTCNSGILIVLWLLYPIFVILSLDGLQFWGAMLTIACITVIDRAAKVGYSFKSMVDGKKVTDAGPRARRGIPCQHLRPLRMTVVGDVGRVG